MLRRFGQQRRAWGVVLATPGMHQQGYAVTRTHDVEQRLHLIGLQRRLTLGVAPQQRRAGGERRHGLGQQFRDRDRRLENARRVNHVAEIQDAADRAGCGIHQQVGGVAIAMDGLAAQAAKPR